MIEYSLLINASPEQIWDCLTKPDLMKRWMGDPEMNLHIETDWTVNGPIAVKGFHHVAFENRGVVEIVDKNRLLRYTSLSSLSGLPNRPENHTSTTFAVEPAGKQTRLTVEVQNFPTDAIYRHYNFYWRGAIMTIKKLAERGEDTANATDTMGTGKAQ